MHTRWPASAFVLGMVMAVSSAWGTCARPLKVAVAPMGQNVIERANGRIEGAYPEFLRNALEPVGCRVVFELMPRARADMLFHKAASDVLVPASRTEQRDAVAEYVPLLEARATLVHALPAGTDVPRSLGELVAKTHLKVAVVRGYDYGPAYRSHLQALLKQDRVVTEADPSGVARALAMGVAQVAIISRNHLHGLPDGHRSVKQLMSRLRSDPLDELGWSDTGLYLSTRALSEADRRLVRASIERAARDGLLWQSILAHYPADVLAGSLRVGY